MLQNLVSVVKLGLEHFRFGTKERLLFYIHKYIQTIFNSSLLQHDTLTLFRYTCHTLLIRKADVKLQSLGTRVAPRPLPNSFFYNLVISLKCGTFSKLQLTYFKYDGCHWLPTRAKLTSYFMQCELKNVAIKRLEKENVES